MATNTHEQPHQGSGSPNTATLSDMGPFSPAAASDTMPLSSRPPSPQSTQQQQLRTRYEDLDIGSKSGDTGGGFPEDEMLGVASSRSDDGDGLGASGDNRWPREEMRALIRIRSEMDATFRDAMLKGRLWEEVSRKLADLGYKKSADKCKEKFESIHKYCKRKKEGHAGRKDENSYHFFSELDALHVADATQQLQQQHLVLQSSASSHLHACAAPVFAPVPINSLPPQTGLMQPAPISLVAPAPMAVSPYQPLDLQGLSSSSMSKSESNNEFSDNDDITEETGDSQERLGKRKRGSSEQMMSLFEGLMQQFVERQEEMQQRFLEIMEKQEAERMARVEAWRRTEVARLNLELDQLSQERAASASRDAAIITFLQRISYNSIQAPTSITLPMPTQSHTQTLPLTKQPPRQQLPLPSLQETLQSKPISSSPFPQQLLQKKHKEVSPHDATMLCDAHQTSGSSAALNVVPASKQYVNYVLRGEGEAALSSRWPKAEVHALIQMRMELEMSYQETGPKGSLWEEISARMRRLGYNRSSKRCKAKWENINKYYKKVKQSNKRRPEDSKTCPYFHHLEAIYNKNQSSGGIAAFLTNVVPAATLTLPEQFNQSRHEIKGQNINDEKRNNEGSGRSAQVLSSNEETSTTTSTVHEASSVTNKLEDIVWELTEQPSQELATDNMNNNYMGDEYINDGMEGKDDDKMQYEMPNQDDSKSAPAPTTTTAPAVPILAPRTTNDFTATIQ